MTDRPKIDLGLVAEEREVGSFRARWQCERRIGGDRCRSRRTRVFWNRERGEAEAFCAKHAPGA